VSRLTNFGVFVTLEPGIDGLIHISKLGGGRKLNHPREAVETGQELEVRIEEVDKEKKRVSLDLAANPAEGNQGRADGDYKAYIQQPGSRTTTTMGSLGELLQKELKKKKR
jgi:small subunit ribosomal protein S1